MFVFRPELVTLEGISERDNKTNLEEAFDIAANKLNVPRLLEPEGTECYSGEILDI